MCQNRTNRQRNRYETAAAKWTARKTMCETYLTGMKVAGVLAVLLMLYKLGQDPENMKLLLELLKALV